MIRIMRSTILLPTRTTGNLIANRHIRALFALMIPLTITLTTLAKNVMLTFQWVIRTIGIMTERTFPYCMRLRMYTAYFSFTNFTGRLITIRRIGTTFRSRMIFTIVRIANTTNLIMAPGVIITYCLMTNRTFALMVISMSFTVFSTTGTAFRNAIAIWTIGTRALMRIAPVHFTTIAILSMFFPGIRNIAAELARLIWAIMRNTPTLITIITFLIMALTRVYRISTKLTGLGTSMIFIGTILLSTFFTFFFMIIMDRAKILPTI